MGRFAARDVPVILHIAVNGHYDPVSPSFKNNGRGATAVGGDAPDSNLGLVAMNNSVELFLSAMILDEVFERHDGLRVLSLEHGASWVPGWLHKLDFVERTTRRGHRAIAWRRTWRERIRLHHSQVNRSVDHGATGTRDVVLRLGLSASRGFT